MRSRLRVRVCLTAFAVLLTAQGAVPARTSAEHMGDSSQAKPPGATPGDPQLPYTPSLDVTAMDRTRRSVRGLLPVRLRRMDEEQPDPGGPVAAGRPTGRCRTTTARCCASLLEQAGAGGASRTPNQQKIGDYYGACMAEPALERLGASPLAPQLTAIASMQSIADMAARRRRQPSRDGRARRPCCSAWPPNRTRRTPTETIAGVDQSGLGLPDRDYYLKDDAKSKTLRDQYVDHVARVLQLLGDAPAQAAAGAQTVLRIETELARGHMSRVDRRNPDNTYHRLPRAKLTELMPSWPWDRYFQQMGIAQIKDLNVTSPGYFAVLEKQLTTVPLSDWKTYLRWHDGAAGVARISAPPSSTRTSTSSAGR